MQWLSYLNKFILPLFYRFDLLIAFKKRLSTQVRHHRRGSSSGRFGVEGKRKDQATGER